MPRRTALGIVMLVKKHWIVACLLLTVAGLQPAGAQSGNLATELVDALNRLSGVYPGYRAAHAKGIVAKGAFEAAPAAASLSVASFFQGRPIPVTVRFSDGTGLPDIPDGSSKANPRGLAIKFHLKDGDEADIVLNNLKFFPVSTGEEFLELLNALAESPEGAQSPTKFQQFVASHPNVPRASATAQTPASFAEEEYRSLNAFVLVSKSGARQAVRFIATPEKLARLDPTEAAKKPPNFLIDDLKSRLAAGPVTFHLQAQLATASDSTKDASQPWPESNKVVDLGVLTIDTLVPESSVVERGLLFLPGRLTKGIEPSDDPLIAVRDAAYAVSFARRAP
jgi:catalase